MSELMKNKGTVFNIQKFALNDGPGIRTTVFLKGCMLNCLWCHNPESKSPQKQLMLYKEHCFGCGKCVEVCPEALHRFRENGEHLIQRENCTGCGACETVCAGALKLVGQEMSIDEILEAVLKDLPFFKNSGGGLTVSGGEPFMQPEFTLNLLKAAKEKGLHTCIETCGYAKWEYIEAFIPYVDLFLWDVKESDAKRHKVYTGVSNERILRNLHRLNAAGANIILRCPIIPGLNDREEHFTAIAELAEELCCVQRIDIEPYHPLGKSKSESLGEKYALKQLSFPEEELVQNWIAAVAAKTSKTVQKA